MLLHRKSFWCHFMTRTCQISVQDYFIFFALQTRQGHLGKINANTRLLSLYVSVSLQLHKNIGIQGGLFYRWQLIKSRGTITLVMYSIWDLKGGV
jgi:hypothetical protein